MKKLFFASVFALASLTACQNENSNDEFLTQPAGTQKVENKSTTAREGEEMSKEEQIAMADAILFVKETKERLPFTDTGRRAPVINCHTDWNGWSGHACVFSGGYMFEVSWTQVQDSEWHNGQLILYPDAHTEYTAVSVHSCSC